MPMHAKVNQKKEIPIYDYLSNRYFYHGPIIKRVYCSINSVGFDFHFNSQTGYLYSYDDFSEELVPYDIRLEIPFLEIIPIDQLEDFIRDFKDAIDGPFTSIRDNKLLVRISDPSGPNNSILASIDLVDLRLKIKVNVDDFPARTNVLIVLAQAEREIKCEYIKPESIRVKYLNSPALLRPRPLY